MTVEDVAHTRLVNQLLLKGSARTPAEVVERLGAIQAQDYTGGELSIGLRLHGSTIADIEGAIRKQKIIRTWGIRGTLHFLSALDIGWVLDLLAPMIISRLNRRYKELELDAATLKKTNLLLKKSLKGGRHLTRSELVAIIEKNGISCKGLRAVFILYRASLDKVICFGVTRGKQQTHTLFEEWVHNAKSIDREKSLAELARRYFTSHGPATIQDYMWWSGLRTPDANAGLEMVMPELTQVTVEGKTYWMPVKAPSLKATKPVAFLLPGFDDFLLGYKDRTASLAPAHAQKIQGGGILKQTIVINGRVVGMWSRTIKKEVVLIVVNTFTPLSNVQKEALAVAVERYGRFIGKEPILKRK